MIFTGTKTTKILSLLIGLSFFLGEELNYSQLGPFFPTEARNKKDVSVTLIGVITGAFDIANFIGCFFLASFVTRKTQKFFFCVGAFISATCNGLFGVMGYSVGGSPFILLCILTRLLMGVGASMVWSTGLPILVPIYPKWAGRITSLVECFAGLGSMVGPTLGSALYSFGGYTLPFIASGGAEIVIGFLAVFILPTSNEPNQNDRANHSQVFNPKNEESHIGYTYWYYITRPQVLVLSGPLILMCSASGFLDVSIGPHLEQKFNIGGDISGY